VDVGWWLTTELYIDTMYFFEVNHKDCTRRLAMVNIPPLPMDNILVEVLFAQLLSLPQPLFKPVFYGTLTINLAKSLPSFQPVVCWLFLFLICPIKIVLLAARGGRDPVPKPRPHGQGRRAPLLRLVCLLPLAHRLPVEVGQLDSGCRARQDRADRPDRLFARDHWQVCASGVRGQDCAGAPGRLARHDGPRSDGAQL